MTTDDIKISSNETTLVVGITGAGSLDAAEFAALLKNFGADYKKLTRSRLMLVRYEVGSSWFSVSDILIAAGAICGQAADLIKAASNMAKFAGALRGLFSKSQSLNPQPIFTGQLLAKSLSRLTKLAAEKGAGIEVSYNADHKAGTEGFSLKMTPAQVRRCHDQQLIEGEALDSDRVAVSRVVEAPRQPPRQLRDAELLARSFSDLAAMSPAEAEGIVEAFVAALKSAGSEGILSAIASSLDGQGRSDIAAMVRKHLPRDRERVMIPRD